MRLHVRHTTKTLTLSACGWTGLLLVIALFSVPYLLSRQDTPTVERATELIRHYWRYQSGQDYAARYRDGQIDAQASGAYRKKLEEIDALRFESVEIGRLFPDYLLGVRPTFFVKAVIQDGDGRRHTHYFNLGRGHLIVGESSALVWAFVL